MVQPVVIDGQLSSMASVIAAYTAKRYGKSVLLGELGRHLGGMSSGGLELHENPLALRGVARKSAP
jgi:hypothetical protein